MPRALIFGMKHHLVDPYQVNPKYAPRAKNGPIQGDTCTHRLILGKHEKIFLSETTRHRAFIFDM